MAAGIQPHPSQVTPRTFVLGTTVLLVGAALAYGIVHTHEAIFITVIAALAATALHHGVDLLTNRRVPRAAALAIVLATTIGCIAGVVLLIVPPVTRQVSDFSDDVPRLMREARQSSVYRFVEQRLGSPKEQKTSANDALKASAEPALAAVVTLVGGMAAIVSTVMMTVFMLIFGGQVVDAGLAQASVEHRPVYERVLRKIYGSVGGYLAGLSFICFVNALLTTVFLMIAHVPFFLPLGILSGLSSLIPYAGPIVAGAVITLISFVTSGPVAGGATFIYYLIYGQLEGHILGPLVYRRTVHVNPLITLGAMLFAAELAGVVGAFVAVPAAAAGQIILGELLAIRRERLMPH